MREVTASSDAAVERTAARIAVAGRISGALTAVLNTASARASLRRPQALYAAGAVLAANTVFTSRRQLRSKRIVDRGVARSDLVAAITLLIGEALARSDRYRHPGARPGTDYAAITAAMIAVEGPDSPQRQTNLAVLLATIWATTAAGRPDGSGTSIAHLATDLIGPTLASSLAARLAEAIRASSGAVRELHEAEVAEAVRLEHLRERARHHRLLHDSVLQVFETIAADLSHNPDDTIGMLDREVARLAHSLEADDVTSFRQAVDEICSYARTLGLAPTVEGTTDRQPTAPAMRALVDAAKEALTNIKKHAHVPFATVRIRDRAEGIELIIEDQGPGFDATAISRGFGLTHSIPDALQTAGGAMEIDSVIGRGTRLVLWVPAS